MNKIATIILCERCKEKYREAGYIVEVPTYGGGQGKCSHCKKREGDTINLYKEKE